MVVLLMIFMAIMVGIHTNIQENKCNTDGNQSESLGSFLSKINIDKKYGKYTKYFSCGSFILMMCIIIFNVEKLR